MQRCQTCGPEKRSMWSMSLGRQHRDPVLSIDERQVMNELLHNDQRCLPQIWSIHQNTRELLAIAL